MLSDLRSRPLNEADLNEDPHRQFAAWYEEAAAGLDLPEAMVLATATDDGAPSSRMVLLKGHDERGFVFHTSFAGRKGRELASNPQAALLFYWHSLGRQVRIEGRVGRTSEEESDAYFRTRPREAQLSAIASTQSEVVESRAVLERRVAELDEQHAGADVPRPQHWGGFRLAPDTFEFWQHREGRLHDRLRYRRDDGRWLIERLAP
jgi:pyridoxamine 5'-phosphate oxidase